MAWSEPALGLGRIEAPEPGQADPGKDPRDGARRHLKAGGDLVGRHAGPAQGHDGPLALGGGALGDPAGTAG